VGKSNAIVQGQGMIIGIDPGISGAIAFFDNFGKLISVHDFPLIKEGSHNHINAHALSLMIKRKVLIPQLAVAKVESVHSMPGQGVASTFKFGRSYGTILGVLGTLGVTVELITPQKWKKKHGLVKKDKDASRILAAELYPLAPLDRKKDHGRADAILIGLY